MSAEKKDRFRLESDDSDQQILPFDFMDDEDEDEEHDAETSLKVEKHEETAPAIADDVEKIGEKIESTSTADPEDEIKTEAPAEANTLPEPENKEESVKEEAFEEIENSDPVDSDKEESKEEAIDEVKAEEAIEEAKTKETPEDKLPKTVKMDTPVKAKSEKETAPFISTANAKPGQILQEARVRKDLSIDQVAQSTKIKKNFITALEEGDQTNLPAPVYVEAYIKTLANLYGIEAKQVLNGVIRRKNGKVVPGELLSHIEGGKQVNFEEAAKVNKFFKVAAIIIIAVTLTIFLIVKLKPAKEPSAKETSTSISETTAPAPKISSEDLEIFITPKPFTMTEMAIPSNKNDDENNVL